MQRFYGRVRAPESERAMLESLGIEVAPLRTSDDEAFHVRMDIAAHARLAELANDFPHELHARMPDVPGPLTVTTMNKAEWLAETAWLDYVAARPGPQPAWFALQRDALDDRRAPYPTLPIEQVRTVLAAHGESADPSRIMHYPTLDILASVVRTNHWTEGEIFVCAIDEARFVLMKQVATTGCEMKTITHHGYHDTLTAVRYTNGELIEHWRDFLQVTPEPALHYAQPIGFSLGGFTVGHHAKMNGNPHAATIVGLSPARGGTGVTLEFAEPQPLDGPDGATSRLFALDWRTIASTWAPPSTVRVLPEIAPYRDDILLRRGTSVEFMDALSGERRTGLVATDYTLADRAAHRDIDLYGRAISEYALRRVVQPAGPAHEQGKRAQHVYRVAVGAVQPDGEKLPLGVVFVAAASHDMAEVRAYDRLWDPALKGTGCRGEYDSDVVPRYVHGHWSQPVAGGPAQDCRLVFDRASYALRTLLIARGAQGWVEATADEVARVQDTLTREHPEALFRPLEWGLGESDTPPARETLTAEHAPRLLLAGDMHRMAVQRVEAALVTYRQVDGSGAEPATRDVAELTAVCLLADLQRYCQLKGLDYAALAAEAAKDVVPARSPGPRPARVGAIAPAAASDAVEP